MTKNQALAAITRAVFDLRDVSVLRKTTLNQFRAANVRLAVAQYQAADAGASSAEIIEASSWNGMPV